MAARRVPEGPPPVPPVQKLRVRYARRGRLRFSSTRDFARALERALRRSGVPMAFSGGFHPHPKISYAGGAPTGAASEAEYFEISLTERADPDAVRAALDQALPEGLDILEVVEAGPGSLADRLGASVWQVALAGVSADDVAGPVAAFLALDRAETTRMFKNGPRTFDVRGAVAALDVTSGDGSPGRPEGCAILQVVVRHTTPAVRPDDVLTALHAATGFEPPRPPRVTRLAQGPVADASAGVADPLAADKGTAGS